MKKRTRLFAFTMALCMMATLLASCGAGSSTNSSPAEVPASSAQEAADPFGRYDETVEISSVKNLGAGIMFPEGDSLENNVWTREYEEALNIKVNWKWSTNAEQYAQKVNIAITSNDIPDVMAVSSTQLKMMYENGQLMDLTQIAEDNLAPFTKEVLNSDGGIGLRSATFDGKLYAIPAVASGLLSAKVLWVRTDWLKNVGMELPTTVDEMLAICEAFTTQDPDGNGKDDTYGLAVYKDLYGMGYADLTGFFNAYNAYPSIWVDTGDGIVYGGVQPEVKEALSVLQELYKTGQIDPEFGVKDANKVNEDVNAGKIGMMFGDFWNAAWVNDAKIKNPEMEWVPVAIPSLDGTTPAKAQLPMGTQTYYVVSAECEHPEAIMRMLNLQLEKTYGETAEPEVYGTTPEGYGSYQYPCISIEPPMKNFTAAQKITAVLEGQAEPDTLNAEETTYYELALRSLDGDYTDYSWHQLKMMGPDGSLNVINKYWEDGNVVNEAFYGAPTQSMVEKLPTLNKQQLQDYTAIILGESIDTFDEFVENWNKLGGEEIEQEVNDWFAQQ